MSAITPLLDFFKRGEVARDLRILAARGALAPRAHEQVAILIHLQTDPDEQVRATAEETLGRIPPPAIVSYLGRSDVPPDVRDFFATRGIVVAQTSAKPEDEEQPLIDSEPETLEEAAPEGEGEEARRESLSQQIANMSFTQRVKAALKGSRELRALLIRDPNRVVHLSVLSSPKVTESEVEAFAKMPTVSEDVLRSIAMHRPWLKNYGILLGVTRNPKTPVAISLNLMHRLNDRDLNMLSIDRNVPEPLRVAARKRVVSSSSRR